MRFLLSAIIILILNFSTRGQDLSSQKDRAESVYLRLRNINFVKNNEYFNPIVEGYTLIGYFIQPSLIYCLTDRLNIQIGAHLLNYAGSKKLAAPKLVFSTSYNLTKNSTLTLGTLNGSEKHRLADPHFDKERLYKYYTENGLQFVTVTDRIFSDTWVSWENFILKGDTTREIFTAGESFNFQSRNFRGNINFELPVQLQFKHYGGQISNYDDHVTTYFNMSAGVRINFDLADGDFGRASVEYDRFVFNELTRKGEIGITHGHADWFRLLYNYRSVGVSTSFWRSNDFYAPNGNPIYSSVSDYNSNLVIAGRSIWSSSVYVRSRPYEFFTIYLGFDLYYDVDRKKYDNSFAIHLYLNKLIKIAKMNK